MLTTEPALEFSPEYPEQAYILNYVQRTDAPELHTHLALALEAARQQVLATLPPAPDLDEALAEAFAGRLANDDVPFDVAQFETQPLDADPGATFAYSTASSVILADIATRALSASSVACARRWR